MAEIAAIITAHSAPALHPAASSLAAQLRVAMDAAAAADIACGKLELADGPALDEAEALCYQRHADVLTLARSIPNPPQRFEDLILLAEVAFHYADRRNGYTAELDNDDVFMSSAARLIEAVVHFARAPVSSPMILAAPPPKTLPNERPYKARWWQPTRSVSRFRRLRGQREAFSRTR